MMQLIQETLEKSKNKTLKNTCFYSGSFVEGKGDRGYKKTCL